MQRRNSLRHEDILPRRIVICGKGFPFGATPNLKRRKTRNRLQRAIFLQLIVIHIGKCCSRNQTIGNHIRLHRLTPLAPRCSNHTDFRRHVDTILGAPTHESTFICQKSDHAPCARSLHNPMIFTKPVLKWVGGKTQILTEVIALFPKEMKNYHEPFVGGGSVLFALLSAVRHGAIKVSGRIYVSDKNPTLIGLYRNIQTNPAGLIMETRRLTDGFAASMNGSSVNRNPTNLTEASSSPESYYYWIRKSFNATQQKDSLQASAMFLFLNKTCFRGIYREGPNGFNVPFGNYKKPTILDSAHLQEVSTLLKDVIFSVQSFENSLASVDAGDFTYLDPPYAPESATSFVSYTADGFTQQMHTNLFKLCADMSAKGAPFLLSNADVPFVKTAFPAPRFTTKILSCRRAIHSKEPSSRTNEVLISCTS